MANPKKQLPGQIASAVAKPALITSSWILPGALLAVVFTTIMLNQAGLITLPHFGNANSNSNPELIVHELAGAATIGAPMRADFSSQMITLIDPEGANGPYTFYLGSGTGFPPMGLILGIDGVLTGTPTGTGGNFQVCIKDVGGRSTCRTHHLTVVPAGGSGQNTNVASGGGLSERWEGTYAVRNVMDTCTTDTTAKISICITQAGQNLTGVTTFPGGLKDTVTKGDPSDICLTLPHCTGDPACNQFNGHLDSSGRLNIDVLILDGIGYFYSDYYESENGQASATITGGNSMKVQFSKSISSGLGSTTSGSFTATKVPGSC